MCYIPGMFHELSRFLDLLRSNSSEIIAPTVADVLRYRGDLFIRELVTERWHGATANNDPRNHELTNGEHRVTGQSRAQPAATHFAMTSKAPTGFIDVSSLGRLVIRRCGRSKALPNGTNNHGYCE